MSLSIGIVGLPNVGKSTLFNALLKREIAKIANYPFTTIEPHAGVIEVPDARLESLCKLTAPERCIPAVIKFIDIAGLVQDAHKGEGLGNQFLSHIREVDAILHVVRDFEDPQVPHVSGSVDPNRDREIIKLELELAGIEKPIEEWVNRKKEDFNNVDELIARTYKLLNLITFYTIKGGKEVHAWPLRQGSTALMAAEKVHTDFAKKFIKAEVILVEELLREGGWNKAREHGKINLSSRDYIVQDGDVIEFKVGR